MSKIIAALTAILISALMVSTPVVAGPAADALATCLANSTTGQDRTDMAKWVFMGIAVHPDMQGLSTITPENREAMDRLMGSLVTRLITESCRSQVKSAISSEGNASLKVAFESIGKLAMQELLTNPKVYDSFTSYAKYLDTNKFNAAFPPN